MTEHKRRLITRGDFDGIVCAALLRERGLVDEVRFAHPKDMQDGIVEVGPDDITANLPFVPGAHLAFDHHASEATRVDGEPSAYVNRPDSPSAARVIWNHFGGAEAFPGIDPGLMDAVDKADAARFDRSDILDPSGWVLLNYLLDARTGLGRFRDFRVPNHELLLDMIDHVRHYTVEEILLLPDVSERVRLYFEHENNAREQIQRCGQQQDNLLVLDLRHEPVIFACNRFLVYALFPQTNVSVHCLWGPRNERVVFAIGKSVLDRSCTTHIGELCLKHGGGGHAGAGTCQVPPAEADAVLAELVGELVN